MANKGDIAVVAGILGTILVLDLLATRAILRDDLSERGQRVAQLALVWLFPLIGALLVLALYRGPGKPSGTYAAVDRVGDIGVEFSDPYLDFPDLSGD